MAKPVNEYGEVRCLLCGRYLCDISSEDGRMRLLDRKHAGGGRENLKLVRGKLHCARCSGRAFVEWDLLGPATRNVPSQAA